MFLREAEGHAVAASGRLLIRGANAIYCYDLRK